MLKIIFCISMSFFFTSSVYATDEVKTKVEKQTQDENVQVKKFIPLSKVPSEAAKAHNSLEKIAKEIVNSKNIIDIHSGISSFSETIDSLLADKYYKNIESHSLRSLEKRKLEWNVYLGQLIEWEEKYTQQISVYDEQRQKLKRYSQLWSETHINASENNAPEAINKHIAEIIIEIEDMRSSAKSTYDLLLIDSNIISVKKIDIEDIISLLKSTKVLLQNRVYYQNDDPFYTLVKNESFSPLLYFKSSFVQLNEIVSEVSTYIQVNEEAQVYFILSALALVGFIGYFNFLYRKQKLFVTEASMCKKEYFFIALPFSVSILLLALLSIAVFNDAPHSMRELLVLVILVPVYRVVSLSTDKNLRVFLLSYIFLSFVFIIEKHSAGFVLDDRTFSLINSFVLIGLMVQFIRYKLSSFIKVEGFKKMLEKFLFFAIFILVLSIISNLYGATLLADKLANGVFSVLVASLIFYALTVVLSGYVVILLRRRLSSSSNILDQYAQKIERNVTLLIKVFMLFWLAKISIRVAGLEANFNALVDGTLAKTWLIGTTTISISIIFSFLFIIVGTWFTAKLTHIILKLEVFSRFKFSRGVPTAILTITNYLIIGSGVLIAFSSLGVSTDQFMVVFGALGVGIGFGLRNIIANFVSGLIMVFERPVQIGDTIEVESTMGEVLSIGARSSSVKTFDGSEVIIPNESFISSKVINWTLSDERRRKILNIKVAFGSDIHQVLSLMSEVAVEHEDVLQDPAPLSTFIGFGDYYLEFKLYYWLTQNIMVAQSDIAISVYEALKKEGVAMPTPNQNYSLTGSRKSFIEEV